MNLLLVILNMFYSPVLLSWILALAKLDTFVHTIYFGRVWWSWKNLIINWFYFWEDVVVLKELIFKFLLGASVVVLKELICNSFYFGRVGGLERTDL